MAYLDHTYAVILAGGGGTRLWPKSRTKTPKQFLKLTSKQTMMQVATARINKFIPWERIIIVTNQRYKKGVREQLPKILPDNIIAEPEKKDTALAMLVGTLYAKSKDPKAVIINSASDHVLIDEPEFTRVMKAASKVAYDQEFLVTVGITPTFPSSAFGYIKIGQELSKQGSLPVFKVDNFTEKPKQATARAFISTGKYFWNANMYVWSADTLEKSFQEHMPEMFELTRELASKSNSEFTRALPEIYKKAESISIDYAVSEKAKNLVLLPGDFGWDDVGNWDVVYNLGEKDTAGNVIISDDDLKQTLLVDSRNNLVHTDSRLVAMVGIENMIVIDTGEVIMVAPKSRSQDVKKLVEALKEKGSEEYL